MQCQVLLYSPGTCGVGRKSFLGRILQISRSGTRLRTKGVEHRMEVEATVCVLYQKVILSPILFLIFQARVWFPFFLKELKMNIASSFTPYSTASKSTLGMLHLTGIPSSYTLIFNEGLSKAVELMSFRNTRSSWLLVLALWCFIARNPRNNGHVQQHHRFSLNS